VVDGEAVVASEAGHLLMRTRPTAFPTPDGGRVDPAKLLEVAERCVSGSPPGPQSVLDTDRCHVVDVTTTQGSLSSIFCPPVGRYHVRVAARVRE
jgi:hypothetical protein